VRVLVCEAACCTFAVLSPLVLSLSHHHTGPTLLHFSSTFPTYANLCMPSLHFPFPRLITPTLWPPPLARARPRSKNAQHMTEESHPKAWFLHHNVHPPSPSPPASSSAAATLHTAAAQTAATPTPKTKVKAAKCVEPSTGTRAEPPAVTAPKPKSAKQPREDGVVKAGKKQPVANARSSSPAASAAVGDGGGGAGRPADCAGTLHVRVAASISALKEVSLWLSVARSLSPSLSLPSLAPTLAPSLAPLLPHPPCLPLSD